LGELVSHRVGVLLYEAAFLRLEERLTALDRVLDPIVFKPDGDLREGRRPADIEVAWASPDLFIDGMLASFMAQVRNATALRWFQCGSAGYDNPMLRQVIERGVAFSINPAPAVSVAEYVLASVLDHFQGAAQRRAAAAARIWAPSCYREIAKSRWLIIGFGTIGRRVARLAKAFDAHIVGMSRHGGAHDCADEVCTPGELNLRLPDADVVVLALPLDATTRGLVNPEFLTLMKRGSVLVNVARGPIVQELALLEALDRGTPEHAVLDVFEKEPLEAASRLWSHPSVTLSAHVAGMGSGLLERSDTVFLHNLQRYLRGQDIEGLVGRDPI
jgi:glyoxylate/hydroxypyruvate reductase